MALKVQLVRDGNSWGIRIPKAALALSELKPDDELVLQVRQGKLIIQRADCFIQDDSLARAKQSVQQSWNEAFEDIWFELVGPDEDI